MATPGELVKCIAAQFAIAEKSAFQKDRILSEAGLRKSGGRGRSAAQMDVTDAAAEMVAILLPNPLREIGDATQEFLELSFRADNSEGGTDDMPFPAVRKLPKDHVFRDALAALITSAASGEIDTFRAEMMDRREDKRIPYTWGLQVTFFQPGAAVNIRFWDGRTSCTLRYNAHPQDLDTLMQWSRELEAKNERGDRLIICEFTQRSIYAVGKLLAENAEVD